MLTPHQTNRPKRALTSKCMEVMKVSLAWSFPSPCFGRLCSHVAVALAWLLHHFPSSKSLDCPLSSLWTILPIDIKSPARSDDVRVMLDWASVRWAFVFFISSSFLFFLLLFSCDVRYPSQLFKEMSLIRHHWSVCDPVVFAHLQCGIHPPTSGRMDCDVIDVNSTPDESAKESSCFHVHGSHLCRLLGLSLLLASADFAHM